MTPIHVLDLPNLPDADVVARIAADHVGAARGLDLDCAAGLEAELIVDASERGFGELLTKRD